MKLFMTPTSPYARKVRAVAIEKGVAEHLEEVLVNPLGEDTADLLDANPLGKVPVLVLEDGRRIYDSSVICEYLDSFGGGSPLLPAEREERIGAQVRHSLANGVIDATFSTVIERMRPEAERSPLWLSRWQGAINRGVEAISDNIVAERFDLGDLCAAIALLYLDFRLPEVKWRTTFPDLAEWLEGHARRPSLQLTEPRV